MNSLAQHVAVEEPDIIAVAIGPGRVDTEMQKEIRDHGAHGSGMTEKDHANFVAVFEEGKLNKPEWPGHVIAKLALDAKPEVDGKYLRCVTSNAGPNLRLCADDQSWNALELAEYQDGKQ